MSGARTQSVRTCVGCRERSSPTGLLRVVLRDGVLNPDPGADLPGRGAWVHPSCVETAERRRAFTRALRAPSAPSYSALKEFIARMSMSVAMDAPPHPDRGTEDEPPMSTQP